MKKKKKKTGFQKIDKYLYKNSYLYKIGKKILKTKIGKTVFALIILYFFAVFTISSYQKHSVTSFVKNWEMYQNRGNYSSFISCVDNDKRNRDRASFPDWKELFFKQNIKLSFKNISVSIKKKNMYVANLLVFFKQNGKIVNKFSGDIFIKKSRGKFKIYRLSI